MTYCVNLFQYIIIDITVCMRLSIIFHCMANKRIVAHHAVWSDNQALLTSNMASETVIDPYYRKIEIKKCVGDG